MTISRLEMMINSLKESFNARFGEPIPDSMLLAVCETKLQEEKQLFIRRHLASVPAKDLIAIVKALKTGG